MENPAEYYQDDVREELINGVVVAMSPKPVVNHTQITYNLYNIVASYLKGKKCRYFGDGVDLYLTEKDHFVPDGMVVCNPDIVKTKFVCGVPDLVVEVLSPSTEKRDRGYKRQVYEQCGVKEYWIVNPAGKSVEIYLLKDGRLEFANVYAVYPDYELEDMTPEELGAIPKSFKCSLFDDLDILIEDVFDRVE